MSFGPNLTLLITLAALQEEGFTEAKQLGKILLYIILNS